MCYEKFFLFLLFLFLCCACNENGEPVLQFFNTRNLPSSYYTIDTERDTVLLTAKGASIRIPKGAIRGAANKKVRLEVKEAYNVSDMMLAGIQTNSDGKMLSSGGMIYIQAADGDAEMVQPVAVSMPSGNFEADMKLFKGQWDKDSALNWTDPQPLIPNQPLLDSIAEGKAIFNTNCSSCHNPLRDATGPPLVFLTQRRNKAWLKRFIHNNAELIASGDPLANCLYNHWNKTVMTAFPSMTDDELEKLYRYLDQVSKNLNPGDYPDIGKGLDSCKTYYKARLELERLRGVKIRDNGPEVERVFLDSAYHDLDLPENLVVPKNDNSTSYSFTITSFGWYNVDAFAMNLPGFESATLKVRLNGGYAGHTNIYLVIPSAKVCVEGGLLQGADKVYGFYTDDGQLSLPQGKQAYILTCTEKKGQILFGRAGFITAKDNLVTVTPVPVTKEIMNKMIAYMDLQDLSVEAKASKNADTIRSIDAKLKQLEGLKPKGNNCDCIPYAIDDYTTVPE